MSLPFLSPLLRRALACLGGDATQLRHRRVRDPATGRPRTITTTVALWDMIDALARDRATTPDALCQEALTAFPALIPGEALWQYLYRETPKPPRP